MMYVCACTVRMNHAYDVRMLLYVKYVCRYCYSYLLCQHLCSQNSYWCSPYSGSTPVCALGSAVAPFLTVYPTSQEQIQGLSTIYEYCILYTVYCTLYTVFCILCTVYCTVCCIQYVYCMLLVAIVIVAIQAGIKNLPALKSDDRNRVLET